MPVKQLTLIRKPVKVASGSVTQDRIPPLKMAARDLVVMNQAKADLMAAHLGSKMAAEEAERQPPHLIPLCNLPLDCGR